MIDDTQILKSIDMLIENSGIKITDLAGAIDVPYRTLQKQLTGESRISAQTLMRILEFFDLNSQYITSKNVGIEMKPFVSAIEKIFGLDVPKIELADGGAHIKFHTKAENEQEASVSAITLALLIQSKYHEECLNNSTFRSIQATKRSGK